VRGSDDVGKGDRSGKKGGVWGHAGVCKGGAFADVFDTKGMGRKAALRDEKRSEGPVSSAEQTAAGENRKLAKPDARRITSSRNAKGSSLWRAHSRGMRRGCRKGCRRETSSSLSWGMEGNGHTTASPEGSWVERLAHSTTGGILKNGS